MKISQNGNLPQIGVKIKNIWNLHPEEHFEKQKSRNLNSHEIWTN